MFRYTEGVIVSSEVCAVIRRELLYVSVGFKS